MLCKKCQNEIIETDKFCGFCGEENKITNPITEVNFSINQNKTLRQQLYSKVHKTYINSETWQNKKLTLSNLYNVNGWPIECIKCGATQNLQNHHNYYIDIKYLYLGFENISDIDYLCAKCHDNWHSIQKSIGLSQNRMISAYLNFVFSNQDGSYRNKIVNLLSQKIKIDDSEISSYFLQENVVSYDRVNNIAMWLLFASFILIFIYGIGIITIIISIIIFSKNKEPENYDLYKQKRIPVEIKKHLIKEFTTIN